MEGVIYSDISPFEYSSSSSPDPSTDSRSIFHSIIPEDVCSARIVLGLGKQNFFSAPSSRGRPSLFPPFQDLRLSSLFCALDDPDPSAVLALVAAAPAALLGRPNAEGEALVHVAAGRGRADVVRALADRAASAGSAAVNLLDAADGAGDGALVWAGRQGHTEVMRLLLDLGCDVNRANEVGDVEWAETNLSYHI